MPLVRGHLGVRACELLAAALDHAIEAHVVLERVGAYHVVVVGILSRTATPPARSTFPAIGLNRSTTSTFLADSGR